MFRIRTHHQLIAGLAMVLGLAAPAAAEARDVVQSASVAVSSETPERISSDGMRYADPRAHYIYERGVDRSGRRYLRRVHRDLHSRIDVTPLEMEQGGTYLFIRIPEALLFEGTNDDIAPHGVRWLTGFIQAIHEHMDSSHIEIIGHFDGRNDPFQSQIRSQRRATAVASTLMSRGVDMTRVEKRGLGEVYPINTNRSAAGRSDNRRVEIILRPQR